MQEAEVFLSAVFLMAALGIGFWAAWRRSYRAVVRQLPREVHDKEDELKNTSIEVKQRLQALSRTPDPLEALANTIRGSRDER